MEAQLTLRNVSDVGVVKGHCRGWAVEALPEQQHAKLLRIELSDLKLAEDAQFVLKVVWPQRAEGGGRAPSPPG